jgi:4-hydroxy-4-methyl-2-oxoglutarate aldolase
VILLPNERIEDILAAAETKMSSESAMTQAIRAGMDPKQAYLKYRVF